MYSFHDLIKPIVNDMNRFVFMTVSIVRPEVQNMLLKSYSGEIIVNGISTGFTVKDEINNINILTKQEVLNGSVKAEVPQLLDTEAQKIIIVLYAILNESSYRGNISKMDIHRFLTHLRNAAAHNNKFYFKGKKDINVMWNGKMINKDMEGDIVFGQFISFFDLYKLINDLSEVLFKIDEAKWKIK